MAGIPEGPDSPVRPSIVDTESSVSPASGETTPSPSPPPQETLAPDDSPQSSQFDVMGDLEREEGEIEQQSIDNMVGEAGGLIAEDEVVRGVPHRRRWEIHENLQRAGRARVGLLVDMFGTDAMILGHLLFDVPPLAIRVRKGNIIYRWKPLRTKESIAVKSGNSECWIEIDLAFVGTQQIRDSLGGLIALWKRVPFCFVENSYIRQNMIPENPEESMALRLESLIMDATAGQPNVVYVTLITAWYNYLPFSNNFWFRRDWNRLGDRTTNPPSTPSPGDQGEDGEREPPHQVNRSASDSIIDLSQIEEPETLRMAQPPEVWAPSFGELADTRDPFLEPTSPVIYPFNSQAFLDYVNTRDGEDRRIDNWTDNLTMKWSSFKRVPVPRPANFPAARSPSVAVSQPPSRSRAVEGLPPPVTGERDVILFMGDSIMVGFTGMSGATDTESGGGAPVPVHWWNPESTNTSTFMNGDAMQGFTVYVAAKSGISSPALVSTWNRIKNDSRFKRESDGDRIAGVVVHIGTNDIPTTTEAIEVITNRLQGMGRDVAGLGALMIILPLPSVSDDPPDGSERQSNASDAFQTIMNECCQSYSQLCDENENFHFLDYHSSCANQTFGTGFRVPYKRDYQNFSTGRINLHPILSGSRSMGRYISSNLPWSSLRGEAQTAANVWTVCECEDGDTLWVCNGDEIKLCRLDHIDTYEIAHDGMTYEAPAGTSYSSEDLLRWLPEAQDSWRPLPERWGRVATARLRELCGMYGDDSTVEVTFGAKDAHQRDLVVLSKGELNINLRLVEEGLAFAFGGDANESNPYWKAQRDAGGAGSSSTDPKVGLWHAVSIPLQDPPDDLPNSIKDHLKSIMRPEDFRSTYKFVFTDSQDEAENCCEED